LKNIKDKELILMEELKQYSEQVDLVKMDKQSLLEFVVS